MFQKESFTIPSDSSGILLVRVIEIRRCSTRRLAKVGKFLKVVIRNTKPILLKRRKKKLRAITIRTSHYLKKSDGLVYTFLDNALVLLKKRMNTVGKELFGPICKNLKIKKFRIAFRKIFKL
jgi:large subunit ribosomal protein L14